MTAELQVSDDLTFTSDPAPGTFIRSTVATGQVRCFELADGREIWRNGGSDGIRLLRS